MSTIGHAGVFSLGRWASRFPTGFHGPRSTRGHDRRLARHFDYGSVTLYGDVFQRLRLSLNHHLGFAATFPNRAPRPRIANAGRLPAMRFRLFPVRSPLLRESRLLSLPEGNEMFHFPSFPPHALCVQTWVTGDESSRVSPFGDPRIVARLPATRGLSQAPTSFIGSWCQGIHRMPLLT